MEGEKTREVNILEWKCVAGEARTGGGTEIRVQVSDSQD